MVVGLDLQKAHPVHCNRVERPGRFVVGRRISRRRDDPALGKPVRSELLALQQLEHRGHQRFRDAVDLIQKQNAGREAGFFNSFIDAGQNLAHRVFGRGVSFPAERLFPEHRKAQRTLTRVVRHRVGDQIHAKLLCELVKNRRLANARRPHEKKRPLPHHRNPERVQSIPLGIGQHRAPDFLFRLFYIHPSSLPGFSASRMSFPAQRGMLISSYRYRSITNATG